MIATEVVSTIQEFAALQDEWNALLDRTAAPNIFLTHGWLTTWWETFRGDRELRIVLLRREPGREIVGILPAYRENAGGLTPGRTLRLLGGRYVSSDFLGAILDPEAQNEAQSALGEFLRSPAAGWDVLELDALDRGGALQSLVTRAFAADFGERFVRTPLEICPYLTLPKDWETLLAGLSRNMRARVRYSRKTLARSGPVEVETVDSPARIDEALRDLMRLRLAWMKTRGYRSVCPPDAYELFHRALWKRLLPEGQVQIRFLRFNGVRVAFVYLLRLGKTAYFYQTAFDEAYARYSVGFVLLGHAIEEAVTTGCTRFEFLRGDEGYKYLWGQPHQTELAGIKIYNTTSAGRLRFALDTALKNTRRIARELREKVGVGG